MREYNLDDLIDFFVLEGNFQKKVFIHFFRMPPGVEEENLINYGTLLTKKEHDLFSNYGQYSLLFWTFLTGNFPRVLAMPI